MEISKFETKQEEFWAGISGDEYIERNCDSTTIAANMALFSEVLRRTKEVNSVLELGSNIGLNLHAIHNLLPHIDISAVEINEKAVARLRKEDWIDIHHESILTFSPERKWDFVFTKGVLIHLNPDTLPRVYDLFHAASSRYIMVSEYYSPQPVEITYRGHKDRLFKRDFAGEILDHAPGFELVDYGFTYHRDRHFPQDDINWFLLEKI